MIYNLLSNLNFWSAISGLLGTVLIFRFGLPPRVNPDGQVGRCIAGVDEEQKKIAKKYKWTSYIGLFLIFISYFIQLVNMGLSVK
jgi:hypothetical protein